MFYLFNEKIRIFLPTAQYFPSSGLTLNDRFAMYQRRAAEKELIKQRKSPEIHRYKKIQRQIPTLVSHARMSNLFVLTISKTIRKEDQHISKYSSLHLFFHRRIDVSPSAFKRHSLLFDEMKSTMENSFKVTKNFEIWRILEKNAAQVMWPKHS